MRQVIIMIGGALLGFACVFVLLRSPQPVQQALAAIAAPVSADTPSPENPTKFECAAYYLSVQGQIQLINALTGKPTVTLGPATDWASQVFKIDGPADLTAVNAAIRKLAAKVVSLTKDDVLKPAHGIDHLQPLVAAYDGPCQRLSGQEPTDLQALAAGKFPYSNPPSESIGTAESPSSLDCAYYYYLTTVPMLLGPSVPSVMALVGPSFAWSDKVLKAADKDALKASYLRVTAQMRRLHPTAMTNDIRLVLGPVIHYYDPPCRSVAGLAALDLDALLAALPAVHK